MDTTTTPAIAPAPAAAAATGLPAAAVAEWSTFLRRALARRLDPQKFAAFVPILYSQYPIPAVVLADFVLRPTGRAARYSLDPRAFRYLDVLLRLRRVDAPAVLRALYKYSSAHALVEPAPGREEEGEGEEGEEEGAGGDDVVKKEEGEGDVEMDDGGEGKEKKQKKKKMKKPAKILRWRNSFEVEESLLWRLAKDVNRGSGIRTARSAIQVAKVLIKWMPLFGETAAVFSSDAFGALQDLQPRGAVRARTAFSLFVYAFSESPVVLATLSRPVCKGLCKTLSDSLMSFTPCIMQALPDVAGHLELFRTQTLCKFLPTDKKESELNTYMDNLIGLDSFQVPEVPVINTRAGLYIYLSAALVGRPMLDDTALFTYLHNRYQGDIQSTAVQLILASFDLLANAVFRNEGPKTGHLLKSYVVNKVPLILVSLASTSAVYPFNPELCITEALGQVDTNVFPTLSGMFDMSNTASSFHDSVRQDFCFSCQLHGLLSQTAIENLLGDITYQSLPDEGRYVKEILIQSCLQDVDKTQKLIGELDNMNGNVGAAAQAITEVIGSLCRNKETMTLKQLCGQLAAKPLSLDVLLLFDKPQKILHPLCELLDNWAGYEEDQGEYQPVYEEFGSILLLLLAFVYRYNLSPADLGIRSPDSFVGKLLSAGDLCRPLEELNEQQKSHLNGWIHGLFVAGGLGDELMASCPPQDFYLLMPTLFHQIVIALSAGRLTDDMLKGGLEYLVDVLLLPSLVPALLYLSNQLWVGGPRIQGAIIKTLQAILRPSSISNESSAMLSSVLNIVAKPLEHALRSYQRQDPKCQEVEPLLRAIKENLLLSRRTGGADHTELEAWCSTHATPTTTITTTNNNHTTTNPSAATHNGTTHNGTTASQMQAQAGGLTAAVRHTVQSLVQWAEHPSALNGMPATYTHRQTLAACKMLGARRLLGVLLEELRAVAATNAAAATAAAAAGEVPGSLAAAYDVVTAIVCAPDVTSDGSLQVANNSAAGGDAAAAGGGNAAGGNAGASAGANAVVPLQRRISLREALKAEADDWKRLQKADPLLAEAVVRLYRRVEAQMAQPPAPPSAAEAAAAAAAAMGLQPELSGLGVGVDVVGGDMGLGEHHDAAMALDAAAAGLDAAAAAAAAGVGVGVPDLGGLSGAMGGGDLAAAGQMGAGSGAGDDIFGGLTGAGEFGAEFGSWDMDLS